VIWVAQVLVAESAARERSAGGIEGLRMSETLPIGNAGGELTPRMKVSATQFMRVTDRALSE
jgi:hypothetical protein